MLLRYQIRRGRRVDELPRRVQAADRQDTRKHTRHCLAPAAELVQAFLADPTEAAWETFAGAYRELLAERFASDRAPFDALATRAREGDVAIGCNCPTARNPDVNRCHTVLALRFMAERYPDLEVQSPQD